MSRLLREAGWSRQQSIERATQRNEEAIKQWSEQRWPAKRGIIGQRNREAEEQDNDGSLRKSGLFHDYIKQVWEAEGDLFSIMAVFSPRDPVAGVVNCAYVWGYGGGRIGGRSTSRAYFAGSAPTLLLWPALFGQPGRLFSRIDF